MNAKRRQSKLVWGRDGHEPVTDPFDAKDCLRRGESAPLARYLREDVARVLQDLADRLVSMQVAMRRRKQKPPLSPASDAAPDQGPVLDWECETSMVLEAVRSGDLLAAVSFLRELAPLLAHLGKVLDPKADSEWRLDFVRRNRGKPSLHPIEKMLMEAAIRAKVRRAGGKKEAAVQDIMTQTGKSRATVFGHLKGRRTKSANL
jgi:hypothetical protein